MGFLSGLLGQQKAPDLKVASVQDILGEVYKSVPGIAENTVKYNELLAPGLTKVQRTAEDIYDPYRGKLRDESGKKLLEQLELGGSLPPDVARAIRQQGFEQGSITGTGVSNSSQANVARNLGLTSLDLLNQRIGNASNRGTNTANLWQPRDLGITPGDAGNLYKDQVDQQNSINKYKSDLKFQNSMNLINRPLSLASSIGGLGGQVAGFASAFGGSGGKGNSGRGAQPAFYNR